MSLMGTSTYLALWVPGVVCLQRLCSFVWAFIDYKDNQQVLQAHVLSVVYSYEA